MSLHEAAPAGAPSAHHFTRLHDETLSLLTEARDYLAGDGVIQCRALPAGGQFAFARESMRLTSRLVQAMAWLMSRRAVAAGEMSAIDACRAGHRLGNYRVCLADDHGRLAGLPPDLCALWRRSLDVFRRIARLEGAARRGLSRRPPRGQTLRPVAQEP